MKHDWIAILSLLAVAGLPVSMAGCSSHGDSAVSSEQGLRGNGDRDADVDEVADEAARGDGGRGFDRDKDSDELADEAATGDRDKDSDELADEAALGDGGRRDHECRDGGGWNGPRDAGEGGGPISPFGGPSGRR